MTEVIALSGGPDSMALLHMLRENNPELIVCHYDHAWSAEESLHADWVVDYCNKEGLKVIFERNETGDKTETGARRLRYNFFERACRQVGATKLYMGHHMDDQVETIIFRLTRGTGIDGLAGIPATRELYPGCDIHRPLMGHTKQQLEEYCELHGIESKFDQSNNDTSKKRNFIRHEVMPKLQELSSVAKHAIVKLGKIAAQDSLVINLLLKEKVEQLDLQEAHNGSWSIDRDKYLALDPVLRNRVWMQLDKGPLTAKRLVAVQEAIDNRVTRHLRGDWLITSEGTRIVMRMKAS